MGGMCSKLGRQNAGAERQDAKARPGHGVAGGPVQREGRSGNGRAVRIMPAPRVATSNLSSRSTCSSAGPTPTPSTPRPPQARADGLTAASSELLPRVGLLAQEGTDEWFKSLSPHQAADWIRGVALQYGGAALDATALDLLCVEIGLHASELGVDHLAAMGLALAQVFHPPASSASSSASLSAALAAPAGYQGLARLLMALLAQPDQALSPEQAGAFVEGLRLSLPPTLAGADAVFRCAICETALAGTPTDTVIAMACGLFAAMVDPAAKPASYSRAHLPALPARVSPSQRAQLQEALNMGKRLALQPCSVLDKEVPGSADDRVRWLLMAYRMPKPQANEARFLPWTRNYRKAVQPLPKRQQLDVLAAVNRTHGLGPLRGTQAHDTADRKALATIPPDRPGPAKASLRS